MYYLGLENRIVAELPEIFNGCSAQQLREKQVLKYVDNDGDDNQVKGGLHIGNEEAVQLYITEKEFIEMKDARLKELGEKYETLVDVAVRKSTQDLAFGDIEKIPNSVITERNSLKKAYHSKLKELKAANSYVELYTISI